jgi:predicted DNA binding CopG/RHH family protein
MKKRTKKTERVNLYIESDLMQLITKKAKENFLPRVAFIKQLLYANLMNNENNKDVTFKTDGK